MKTLTQPHDPLAMRVMQALAAAGKPVDQNPGVQLQLMNLLNSFARGNDVNRLRVLTAHQRNHLIIAISELREHQALTSYDSQWISDAVIHGYDGWKNACDFDLACNVLLDDPVFDFLESQNEMISPERRHIQCVETSIAILSVVATAPLMESMCDRNFINDIEQVTLIKAGLESLNESIQENTFGSSLAERQEAAAQFALANIVIDSIAESMAIHETPGA